METLKEIETVPSAVKNPLGEVIAEFEIPAQMSKPFRIDKNPNKTDPNRAYKLFNFGMFFPELFDGKLESGGPKKKIEIVRLSGKNNQEKIISAYPEERLEMSLQDLLWILSIEPELLQDGWKGNNFFIRDKNGVLRWVDPREFKGLGWTLHVHKAKNYRSQPGNYLFVRKG